MVHGEQIYLSPPDIGALEEEYVLAALRSGWIAPVGPAVARFEAAVAERVGVPHAVALSSGTAGLHLGLLALGVQPGDAVLTSTLTFAATANAIMYTGARPVFVDVDPESGNIDPVLVEKALVELRAEGRRVGALVPVDLLGRAADYTALEPLAREHGVPLLADAAEAMGASHAGRPAGSFGAAAVLSFNGNKIMTTSGGGMLLTADGALADRVRYLATQARQPVLHYEHTDVGYNYRLSNVLAALGVAQLERLDGMIARRRAVRDRYRRVFADQAGVTVFQGEDDAADNAWLTSVVVDPGVAGWSAGDLVAHLQGAAVECRPLWKPMHRQPVFAGERAVVTGVADRLFEQGVTLPSGSVLTDAQLDRVEDSVRTFLEGTR